MVSTDDSGALAAAVGGLTPRRPNCARRWTLRGTGRRAAIVTEITSRARVLAARMAAMLVVATLLGGCGGGSLEQMVVAEGLPQAALVRLSMDRGLAAQREGNRVHVIEFRKEGAEWVRQVLTESRIGNTASSLDLISLGGDTGDEWNTFVYGVAPNDATRVELLVYDGEGGNVIDGAWLIVLRDRDLTPDDMHWRFLDAHGAVIDSGSGIFPPAP